MLENLCFNPEFIRYLFFANHGLERIAVRLFAMRAGQSQFQGVLGELIVMTIMKTGII